MGYKLTLWNDVSYRTKADVILGPAKKTCRFNPELTLARLLRPLAAFQRRQPISDIPGAL
jgi:hypothetical protein